MKKATPRAATLPPAAKSKAKPATAAHTAPAQVRIIGGQYKRSLLPVADVPGLRPTPNRVRETLFNWLGQDLTGWRVLDAFAGSGALGLEAASRGAARVLMLERSRPLVNSLQAICQRLGAQQVHVQCTDALAWMKQGAAGQWDLILLDPPFDADLHPAAIAAAWPLLAPGGLLYVESAEPLAPPQAPQAWRNGRAGAVCHALFRREAEPSAASASPSPPP